MTKMDRLLEIYQQEGAISAIQGIGAHILVESPAAPQLKRLLGDVLHHKVWMYCKLGYWPHIKQPRTFNEKIMHRKLFSDNDLFSTVEDKWSVRDYVSDKVGPEILPEIYYVTADPDSIPFDSLPSTFVIKPTHLSDSSIILVDNKLETNCDKIRDKCKRWLSQSHGQIKGEYWYEQIEPQIIIEERLHSNENNVPLDYKFLVFHGNVKAIHVTLNRFSTNQTTRTVYDRNWNPLDVKLHFDKGPEIAEPDKLDEMIRIAEELGEDFSHIRVDLYSPNDNEIVFGEMTVAESSGSNPFIPREYDFKLGKYWDI